MVIKFSVRILNTPIIKNPRTSYMVWTSMDITKNYSCGSWVNFTAKIDTLIFKILVLTIGFYVWTNSIRVANHRKLFQCEINLLLLVIAWKTLELLSYFYLKKLGFNSFLIIILLILLMIIFSPFLFSELLNFYFRIIRTVLLFCNSIFHIFNSLFI